MITIGTHAIKGVIVIQTHPLKRKTARQENALEENMIKNIVGCFSFLFLVFISCTMEIHLAITKDVKRCKIEK